MIFLVLAIFHPFGLHQIDQPMRYYIEFGYGLVTFFILTSNSYLLPKLFPQIFIEKNWKVIHEIGYVIFTIFIISIGNTIYTHFCGFGKIDLFTFSVFIFYTIIVAIFPVTILIILSKNHFLKQNLKDAANLNTKIENNIPNKLDAEKIFKFTGQSENDTIELEANEIYFIQSQRNYLEFYIFQNHNIQTKLIRATLKEAENSIKNFPFLQRCHRSFIVNINHIQKIDGDSLGYSLQLKNTTDTIPVSRSYTKEFKKKFI